MQLKLATDVETLITEHTEGHVYSKGQVSVEMNRACQTA